MFYEEKSFHPAGSIIHLQSCTIWNFFSSKNAVCSFPKSDFFFEFFHTENFFYTCTTYMFYVFSYSDMHRDQCGEMYEGLCQKMTSINGEVLLKFLRNVSFKGTSFILVMSPSLSLAYARPFLCLRFFIISIK